MTESSLGSNFSNLLLILTLICFLQFSYAAQRLQELETQAEEQLFSGPQAAPLFDSDADTGRKRSQQESDCRSVCLQRSNQCGNACITDQRLVGRAQRACVKRCDDYFFDCKDRCPMTRRRRISFANSLLHWTLEIELKTEFRFFNITGYQPRMLHYDLLHYRNITAFHHAYLTCN